MGFLASSLKFWKFLFLRVYDRNCSECALHPFLTNIWIDTDLLLLNRYKVIFFQWKEHLYYSLLLINDGKFSPQMKVILDQVVNIDVYFQCSLHSSLPLPCHILNESDVQPLEVALLPQRKMHFPSISHSYKVTSACRKCQIKVW